MRMVMMAGNGNDREGFAEWRPPEASDTVDDLALERSEPLS